MTSKLSLLTGILALDPILGSAATRILEDGDPTVRGTAAPEKSETEEEEEEASTEETP